MTSRLAALARSRSEKRFLSEPCRRRCVDIREVSQRAFLIRSYLELLIKMFKMYHLSTRILIPPKHVCRPFKVASTTIIRRSLGIVAIVIVAILSVCLTLLPGGHG